LGSSGIIRRSLTLFLRLDGAWSFFCSVLETVLLVVAAYSLIYGILLISLVTISESAPLFAALLPAVRLAPEAEALVNAGLTALPDVNYIPSFVLYFGSGALSFVYLFLLRGAANGSPVWLVVVIALIVATLIAFGLDSGVAALGDYSESLRAMRTESFDTPEAMQKGIGLSAFRAPNVRTLGSATIVVPTILGILGILLALIKMLVGGALKLLFPVVRQGMRFRLPFTGAGRGRYNWRRLAPTGKMLVRIGMNLVGITALGPISVLYWLFLIWLINLFPERAFEETTAAEDYALVWIASVLFFLPVWLYIYLRQRKRLGWLRMVFHFVFVNLALIVLLALLYEYAYDESLPGAVFASICIFIGYAARLTFFSSLLEAFDEWRSASRATAAQLMEVSRLPPILFLRTFDEDDLWVKASNLFDRIVFAHRRRRARLEEAVADESFAYGPVIALSNPKLNLQPLGAARENVSDDHWQDYVTRYIEESQFVILCLGKTDNVRWEIGRILALDAAEKLIVVLPTSYPSDRTITEVSPVLAERLGIPDGDYELARLKRTRAIYFDRRRGGHVALLSRQRGEHAYETIMRSALAGTRRSRARAAAEAPGEG